MVNSEIFAKALLQRAEADGINVSNLKLQKLVYYCQGYHLAQYNEPLIDADIKAWPHGPVVSSLYAEYRGFGKRDISVPSETNYLEQLSDKALQVIDFVMMELGRLGAWQLRNKSHQESPWLAHYDRDNDSVDFKTITHVELTEFFTVELSKKQDDCLAKHLDKVDLSSERISLPDEIKTEDDFYNWIQSL